MASEIASPANRPRDLRDRNLRLVVRLFREKGILSIQEAAAETDLSRTTTAKIIAYLLECGLILPLGKGSSTPDGGKRPEVFCLNASSVCVISAFFTHLGITGVLYDLNCDRLSDLSVKTGISYEENADALAQAVTELQKRSGLSPGQLCGIAVGCSGIVDTGRGVLRYPNRVGWEPGLDIAGDLQSRLNFPAKIYVDNTCRYFGYAEANLSHGRGEGTMATVYSDRFSGGCVITGDKLLRGPGGFVGELGHMVLDADSKAVCACGASGCFEALVSGANVAAYAEEIAGQFPNSPLHDETVWGLQDFFAASNNMDPFAMAVMDKVVGYFAALIRNIILLHDPRRVVIQGAYADGGEYFLLALREAVQNYPFYGIKHSPEITYSQLNFTSDNPDNFALGGAIYAVDNYIGQFVRAKP
ncbi:MAG: ROK family protein [Oscillospiraceae bacterium]|nr:ROK family protein [Oscillospiraceae bacterium]